MTTEDLKELKYIRRKACYSKMAVRRELKFTREMLDRMESGDKKVSVAKLEKLLRFYGYELRIEKC